MEGPAEGNEWMVLVRVKESLRALATLATDELALATKELASIEVILAPRITLLISGDK